MRIFVSAFVVLLVASTIHARIWRVNLAGTGDAPDLYAAMDSAQASDEVLLEPGEYVLGPALTVPENVHLRGEAGAGFTRITRNAVFEPGTVELLAGAQISGIHVRSNANSVLVLVEGIATSCILESLADVPLVQAIYAAPVFDRCLLVGGRIGTPAHFVQCIIMSNLGYQAVGSAVYLSDVLGTVDPRIDVSPLNGNFSLDPQFCGIVGSGNYFLKSTSPCLPENGPFGRHVGPLPMGCGTVRVEHRTWGGVKALYR
jgi:hypothetical protein